MSILGALIFLAGLVGMVKPKILRLPNRWIAGAITVIGLVLVGVSAEDQPAEPELPSEVSTPARTVQTPEEYEPEASWREVASWTGSGIKETETFDVQSHEWRIRWTAANEAFQGAGILQIMVYEGDGALKTLAANKQGVGEDVSYVRGDGPHYLMINSGNVDWTVIVEDQR
jgi:hypothetical protein